MGEFLKKIMGVIIGFLWFLLILTFIGTIRASGFERQFGGFVVAILGLILTIIYIFRGYSEKKAIKKRK
jgi:hypothetical protein